MPQKRSVKRHPVTQPSDVSYKFIALTRNQNAIVDATDFDWLSQWNWCVKGEGRAVVRRDSGRIIYMHRVILGCEPGKEVDHINQNPMDNRRANLRQCTHAENCWNFPKMSHNSSGWKGVSWDKRSHKWGSNIYYEGKHIYLGNFESIKETAEAYDEAAKKYYGEFACLNFT